MPKYFVWVPSSLGPIAQIWHDKQTDGNGKSQLTIGKPIKLDVNDTRTIEELRLAYPYAE